MRKDTELSEVRAEEIICSIREPGIDIEIRLNIKVKKVKKSGDEVDYTKAWLEQKQ